MAAFVVERPPHVPESRVVDFDMYAPPGVEHDFHDAWRSLQAPGVPDLVWTMRNGGHWIATRGALIRRIFSDFEHFSSRVVVVPKAIGELHKMLPTSLDPPLHRPYRALLNESFAPRAVHALEPAIRACAVALTEAVRKRGACNFTTAYAELFPIQIFMRLVDLPIDDAPRLKRWADLIIRADSEATFESAKQGLYDYLARYITARRGASGTDLLSQLANGRVAGELLPEREAVDFAVQVMIAGLDTVVNFLGFAFLYLARHPAERRELIEQPGLIAAAVEELLRRYPIVTIGREVRGEVLLDGVELRPGDMILIPTPLVGLDERLNEHAVQVDFHRQGPQHATFGEGRHACAGIHLARLELKVAVEEWLARIPQFKVAPEAELRFRGGIVAGIESLPLVWDVATTRAATEVHA